MNLLQIFGFKDVPHPELYEKGILVKSAMLKKRDKSISIGFKGVNYRQRSSMIEYSNNGCSVKRSSKSI